METCRLEMSKQHEAVVEVPRDLVQQKQPGTVNENPRETNLVLGLARRAALGAFPTISERVIGLYDEDPPIWYEERPHVMNERPCDNEVNGTRAWRIV
jgi:hypothetical protein